MFRGPYTPLACDLSTFVKRKRFYINNLICFGSTNLDSFILSNYGTQIKVLDMDISENKNK